MWGHQASTSTQIEDYLMRDYALLGSMPPCDAVDRKLPHGCFCNLISYLIKLGKKW